jgi:hypothetical protein
MLDIQEKINKVTAAINSGKLSPEKLALAGHMLRQLAQQLAELGE